MHGDTIQDRLNPPHVLFSILDWGMGHATRTWPLIVAAWRLGARVTIASRGTAASWLDARMTEWDSLHPEPSPASWTRVEKPGVTIRYARGIGTLPRIALQMPGFIKSISEEHRWTTEFALTHGVTHVFSDNCYGAWADVAGVSNVLMSHQLHPPLPLAVRGLAVRIIRRCASRFDAVWVPDTEGRALAGRLSAAVSSPTRYIGPLSRFQVFGRPKGITGGAEDNPVLLGIVSGPEPQRSALEEALRMCFLKDGRPALILAGKPGGGEHRKANVLTVPDPGNGRFRAAVLAADIIVCRSGYSTLLDLVVLGRTAILVPTAGQPEQETLARDWKHRHGWTVLSASELADFELERATGQPVRAEGPGADGLIQNWLQLEPVGEPQLKT